MKLVVDTNVIFSALYTPDSPPGQIIALALAGDLQLFAPDSVRDELERNLREKLHYSESQWSRTVDALPISWIAAATYELFLPQAAAAIRDPDDVPIVAVALLLGAGVVSGDRAFHPLRKAAVKTWRPRDIPHPAKK